MKTEYPADPWSLTAEQALEAFDSQLSGVDDAAAQMRLQTHGKNQIAEKVARSPWLLLLHQFTGLLVIILMVAAALSAAIGDLKDAIVIMVVVLINGLLGFYQEFRAERSLDALRSMLATRVRVRRGGQISEISTEDLVPGDIVLLEAGDRTPADGRWILAHHLEVDEAALTGESLPVNKITDPVPPHSVLADRANGGFMNTVVTRGRGELLVTATGSHSEIGKIGAMLAEAREPPTPLQVQLNVLGKRLAMIAGVVVTLVAAMGLWRGEAFADVLVAAIALAVAAIPEGLPAVVTVTLAIGMFRMAKSRAIVKRLAAVETLGCTTVICSDKTGTLTVNQMTAREIVLGRSRYTVSGLGYGREGSIQGAPTHGLTDLLVPIALCNDSEIKDTQLLGDPTEGALLSLAMKGGIDVAQLREQHPRLSELPFDSAVKMMATVHFQDGRHRVFVKGAPDVLLHRSKTVWHATQGHELMSEAERAYWLAENDRLAEQGLRVLAVAVLEIETAAHAPTHHDHLHSMRLIGLVGMSDPPRPEARDAIALCRSAGIQVKMITGDHATTARAIARELGLQGEAVNGVELDQMSDEELRKRIDSIDVFARVTPSHKVRLVQILRGNGHVVAMTGDGVNDAAALKQADIGVAMGITGTEVTKQAATMVLTDDNFATIVGAVREGRTIYENIVKFVRFQLATNVGAVLSVLGSSLLGWSTPFSPVQILWINIIMDGPPALTLGLDPARRNIMQDKPRRSRDAILTKERLGPLLFQGLIMAIGTLGVYRYSSLTVGDTTHALSLAFTTFVLFQFFNVLNARAGSHTIFSSETLTNAKLGIALLCVVILQIIVVHWGPAQGIFNTTDLSGGEWLLALGVASSVLILEELRKWVIPFLNQK
jgi:P-type Ca2+ transporter type 2C